MRTGKYMDDYNYHDWSKFMVTKPDQKPSGPHFAAILFDVLQYTTAGYDRDDPDEHHNHEQVIYFAFPDKETLHEWVLRAAKDKKQFFFFEVKKMGEHKLLVNVDLGI